jgi:hypothetical protein
MINYEKIVLDELFFIKFKLPDDVFQAIKAEVQEMKDNNFEETVPYNTNLAGAIEQEYSLFKCRDAINDFFYNCNIRPNGKRLKLAKAYGLSLWVNFQKKHEYNPLHNHDSSFSFVTWVNIPYTLENELACSHAKSGTSPMAPAFMFLFSKTVPDPRFPVDFFRIEVEKKHEGLCLVFPSNLQHMVTPFYTSDDYRISVSGNFDLVDAD